MLEFRGTVVAVSDGLFWFDPGAGERFLVVPPDDAAEFEPGDTVEITGDWAAWDGPPPEVKVVLAQAITARAATTDA